MTMGNNNVDTTETKVFVGGLAWETPKDAMHDHFRKYGDIVEAVIITDKISGRSKGYGFVTFKEPEAAKKACEDATPTINGRRANCNLAALGARRPPRSASATPPPHQQHKPGQINGGANVLRGPTSGVVTPPPSHVQWYYPGGAAPFHGHRQHQAIPFYPAGYTAAYITGHDHVGYNQHKVNYSNSNGGGAGAGAYMNGHYTQMYPTAQSMYPYYPYAAQHQQQAHHSAMGLPAQFFQPTSSGPITISKPTIPICIAPPPVCLKVE